MFYILDVLNNYLWLILSIVIIIISIYFTFKLKFIQLKKIRITKQSFSNLMISLGAKIGVGSISGIALSIYLSGPGTILWIWVFTLIISSITYAETYLGVKYKVNNNSSPSYYIKNGINNTFLASLYSIMIIITHIVGFTTIQSNTVIKSIKYITNSNTIIIGLALSIVCAFFIYGGINKVVKLSKKLVPFMSIIYIASALIIIIINIDIIPNILLTIIKGAFNMKSFYTGFLYTIIMSIQKVIFSTEAGMGTSAIAASNSSDSANYQGSIQIIGNYIMTFLICTSTALIVIISNYNYQISDPNGIEIALYAFNYSLGNIGTLILIISTLLFSISTITSGYFFCEKCLDFFNNKYKNILKYFSIIFTFIGTLFSSTNIWLITNILVGLVTIINIYSIFKLRNKIK